MLFFYHCVSGRKFCMNFRSQKISWNVSTDRGKVLLNFCLYNASPVSTCYLILMFFISRISSWCLKCVAGFAAAFRRDRWSSRRGWAQAALAGAWRRGAVLTPRQMCVGLWSGWCPFHLRSRGSGECGCQTWPHNRGNGNPRVNSFLLLCDHLAYFDP